MDVKEMLYKELCIKYGYSEKESEAYIKGYQDCEDFLLKRNGLTLTCCSEPKEYYRLSVSDDVINNIIKGKGLKPLSNKE